MIRMAFVCALALVAPVAAADLLDLAVGDVLAAPGAPVELVAKLEKKVPRGTNVPAASIEFRLDGKRIGQAATDERGIAKVKITAPDVGDHAVKAVYEGSKDLQRAEYVALLAVRKADAAIAVVDVDWTVAMTDDLNTSAGGVDCPPIIGAPEGVNALARDLTVVYLTSRARQLRKRTVSWLFRYGFPRGVTYFLDPGEYPTYDVAAFKTAVLKALAATFTGLKVGIGNDAEDVAAYRSVNLRALTIGKTAVAGAEPVATWAEVEKAIAAKK